MVAVKWLARAAATSASSPPNGTDPTIRFRRVGNIAVTSVSALLLIRIVLVFFVIICECWQSSPSSLRQRQRLAKTSLVALCCCDCASVADITTHAGRGALSADSTPAFSTLPRSSDVSDAGCGDDPGGRNATLGASASARATLASLDLNLKTKRHRASVAWCALTRAARARPSRATATRTVSACIPFIRGPLFVGPSPRLASRARPANVRVIPIAAHGALAHDRSLVASAGSSADAHQFLARGRSAERHAPAPRSPSRRRSKVSSRLRSQVARV